MIIKSTKEIDVLGIMKNLTLNCNILILRISVPFRPTVTQFPKAFSIYSIPGTLRCR